MTSLSQGQRLAVASFAPSLNITVAIDIAADFTVDLACFGLDAHANVGRGGSGYGIFEKLDDLPGRLVDNCNFFALDRLDQLSEEALYAKLMEEFPLWLKDAKAKGILV